MKAESETASNENIERKRLTRMKPFARIGAIMSENRDSIGRSVAFRIDQDLYDRYAAVAEKDRRRMSDVFRFGLEKSIDALERAVAERATRQQGSAA
jgi:hypothetical protein